MTSIPPADAEFDALSGGAGERAAIGACMRAMRCELDGATYDDYMSRLAERGGIIEERIAGLVGLTAVGNSHDEADEAYRKTVAALDSEATSAS